MKAFVFTDEALASEAGRFVWLEVNTERAENAPFRTRFTVQALPTYFIIDSRSESILGRRVGGATVAQLREFLDVGHAAFAGAALSPSDRQVAVAESLYAAGDGIGAVEAYRRALAEADPQWTGYGRTVEALLFALQMQDDCEATAKLAMEAWPRLRMTAAAANVAASGLDCAAGLPPEHPDRARLFGEMVIAAREVISDERIPVVADDRSAAYGSLVGAYEAIGDSVSARGTAEAWFTFLQQEADRAASPQERAVFDSHRLSALFFLGQPERAVPFLERAEQELPDDYNPPARLAVVYYRMGEMEQALAANDRALEKAYGPRKLRILMNRADILAAQERPDQAQAALREALTLAEGMPDGQRSESMIAALKRRLGES